MAHVQWTSIFRASRIKPGSSEAVVVVVTDLPLTLDRLDYKQLFRRECATY